MKEEYWKKWEEKGVIKDISGDLREDFSGAKVELEFERKPSEEKKEEKEEKKTEEKKSSKGKTVFSGLLLGAGIFLIFTLLYKLLIKGYFSTYYLMACILGITLAGIGAYIMPKKQKALAIGVGITISIICTLIFSRAIVFIKQYI